MPRFALLIHDSPRGLHYDLLLEAGEVLKTWALSRPPATGEEIECEALPDHRLLYLDYEGPISGGRGTVTCWDRGEFNVKTWNDAEIRVKLAGAKLVGTLILRRMCEEDGQWRLTVLKGVEHPS